MSATALLPSCPTAHGGAEPCDDSILRANSAAYDWAAARVAELHPRRSAEVVLRQIELAARSAAIFHAGRFADGAIENPALAIGRALPARRAARSAPPSRRRILHVISSVHHIGGHTRMVCHWINADAASQHSVVLLRQDGAPVPAWLVAAVERQGGAIALLPGGESLTAQALRLRQLASDTADLVVLHHAAWDVVPTVAFAPDDGPPVAVLNHADHQFWLGGAVADLVINLRAPAVSHTRERRFVRHGLVLPIPLPEPAATPRAEARRALDIAAGEVVLLTVARGEKFRRRGRLDFIATASRLLERNPAARLFVVGETLAGMADELAARPSDRLQFCGVVEDPSLYRAAADVFLETFPFGSQTSVLEAALAGVPIVPACSPLHPLLVAHDDSLADVLTSPADPAAYIVAAERLIQNPDLRRATGPTLQERVAADHVGDNWTRHLEEVYRVTDALDHRPRPLPVAPCVATADDVGLSRWHVASDGRSISSRAARGTRRTLRLHQVHLARETGNHAAAVRHALAAVRQQPSAWAGWRLLGGAALAAVLGRGPVRLSGF